MNSDRIDVGIWSELPPGTRWGSDGVSRLIEFIIDGSAAAGKVRFIVTVPKGCGTAVRASLAGLKAKEERDWLVAEPAPDFTVRISQPYRELANELGLAERAIELADYANRHVKVSGWIISFPQFSGALLLDAPVATVVPDTLPFDFPVGWHGTTWDPNGFWTTWRRSAGMLARNSSSVIVFSQHVARRHAVGILGCSEERIHVIPHAPQDLAPMLPFISNRRSTNESLFRAGEILRDYARRQGWAYLSSFPFETTQYIIVSTHDRPTKNIFRVAEAVRRLIREEFKNIKMITTAPLLPDAEWTRLPAIIKEEGLELDIISMPDLPRDVHAALFHAANLAIHPSMFEGGLAPFPFYEALSVGTPCIMARGPHVSELIGYDPDVEQYVYDPYDVTELVQMVKDTLDNRDQILNAQLTIFNKHLERRSWTDVAHAYASAAVGTDAAARIGLLSSVSAKGAQAE